MKALLVVMSLAVVTVSSKWNSFNTKVGSEEVPISQTQFPDDLLISYQLPEVVVTASAIDSRKSFNQNTAMHKGLVNKLSMDELVKFKIDEQSELNSAEAEAMAIEELEKLQSSKEAITEAQLDELIRFKVPAVEEPVQEPDSTVNIAELIKFKLHDTADPVEEPQSK